MDFRASFRTSSINIAKNATVPIVQCVNLGTNTSISYGMSNLSIVNEYFDSNKNSIDITDHDDIALYTQIADKQFNVTLISLEQSQSNIKNLIEFGGNESFAISLIKTPNFDSCLDDQCKQNLCNDAVILEQIYSGNFSSHNGSKTIPIENIVADNAIEKASFKIDVEGIDDSSCSIDSFSIRPLRFKFSNDTLNDKLIGAKEYKIELEALKYDNLTIAKSYNQTANKIEYENAVLTPRIECNLTEFNTTVANTEFTLSSTKFILGKGNITIKYNNIGSMNMLITDKNWTLSDNVEGNFTDCIPNSSINEHLKTGVDKGKLGCDISLGTNLTFVPKGFKDEVRISNFEDGSYTYISDNAKMFANIYMSISAILDNNDTATKYHKNCFANDIAYEIQLTNDNLSNWNNRGTNSTHRITYIDIDGNNSVNITDNNSFHNGTGKFETTQGNFTNGTANIRFGFNFIGRSNIKPENPFKVVSSDFDINELKDTAGINSFIVDKEGDADFYYGRAHSKHSNYMTCEDAIDAVINYEVYCTVCNVDDIINANNRNSVYPSWYINKNHNGKTTGDVTTFIAANATHVTLTENTQNTTLKHTSTNIANGIETLGVIKNAAITHRPLISYIRVNPVDWLYNLSGFLVTFQCSEGGWAGSGRSDIDNSSGNKTGRVIEKNPNSIEGIKLDW
jgi:hypothetical protein